jgi:phenylalanyl-tRNA synthetase beta chain
MKVSRAWLQTYFDKPIPPANKLAELFTFHSFEVEGVEKMAFDDTVLDVKILPDRAHYCLSHRGVAEEISVLTKLSLKKADLEKADPADVPISIDRQPVVTIEDPHFCRRFTGRFVENIDTILLGQSSVIQVSGLITVAALLTAIGQRSISPVVDITNFVMFDIGQPTHAFDSDKIVGDIVIRAAKAGEKITLLDGKEYTLTADDHVIADSIGALDIAGVKGGKRAEVTTATRAVLLTSANFDPTAVRRTSTRLNLRNEASKRFENEITPELAMEGMHQLSSLLWRTSTDATSSSTALRFGPIVDEYPIKAVQTTITLDPSYINERLDIEISEKIVKDILERFSIGIDEKKKGKMWSLTIPFHRLDLAIPEDIVEEVGRIYGYEHIIGKLPDVSVFRKNAHISPSTFYYIEKIKNVLVEAGFSEVYLYTLAPKGDIEVAYPLACDKAALRMNLSAGLGACLEMNVKNAELLGLEAVKIFEIGKVFVKDGSSYKETLVLALAAAQVKKIKGMGSAGKSLVSEALKKVTSALGTNLGSELTVKSLLSGGSSAVCEIELDEKAWKMEKVDDMVEFSHSEISISYKPFSLYPFIVRDIAVFVPTALSAPVGSADALATASDVWAEIEKGIADADATTILVRHSLFDTFKKEGKISYAFRLIFQSMNRTLTDAETNAIMEKVYARMVARGWHVR